MNITSIKIRNFRSFRQLDIAPNRLNIFVGKNDSGKSNILRALDLFFNHATDYPFDWKQDYCAFAHEAKRKAPEIEISLTASPPRNFTNQTPIIWRKTWRRQGLHKEEMRHVDRSELSPKNKFSTLLRSVRYDYVPAIKGEAYFGRLLGKMHDMLELTVEKEIRNASGDFMDAINAHTGSIIAELLDRLSLDTTIQLPPNLRDLFAQLDFRSTEGDQDFSLVQRGDGIKVRHIPIILRWLAKQAETLSAPGRPKVVTIWGYEEPENNLELSRCQDAAEEFLEDSWSIQTFISTHSPAFYSIYREDDIGITNLFGVKKTESGKLSEAETLELDDLSQLDDSMGLMPLVAPHYERVRRQLNLLKTQKADLPPIDKPVLFVEGRTDKTVLLAAISHLFPGHEDLFTIYTKRGAGCGWVADRLIAWAHTTPPIVGVGLFDNDPKGKAERNRVNENPKAKACKYTKTITLGMNRRLIGCAEDGFPVPHAIEELFPSHIWDHAENKGWLEQRPDLLSLYRFARTDVTFDDHIAGSVTNESRARYIRMRVIKEKKRAFASYVRSLRGEDQDNAFKTLKPAMTEILSALGLR